MRNKYNLTWECIFILCLPCHRFPCLNVYLNNTSNIKISWIETIHPTYNISITILSRAKIWINFGKIHSRMESYHFWLKRNIFTLANSY
uniref:Uncharacterized protein n=1 Tax=Lepeophtheirus salmonis TaxID=72036 RepID=A0A0K2TXA1_LEPSM